MKKQKKETVKYTVKGSGGGFILIMTLLPVFWESCPWTWYAGLAISFGIMLVLNIGSFLVLKMQVNKVAKMLEDAGFETQEQSDKIKHKPIEYQNMYIDPELSYLVAQDGTDMIVMHKDEKCYALLAAYDGHMQAAINAIEGAENAKPVRQHISSTINWVQTNEDIDGLCFVCGDGYQLFSKEELTAMPFRDFIDVKLGGKWHDERGLFVIFNSEDGEDWNYTTSRNRLAVFFTELDASLCATNNGFEQFKVEKLYPEDILPIVQQCDGLTVMDCDGLVLYKNDTEHITKILQPYTN